MELPAIERSIVATIRSLQEHFAAIIRAGPLKTMRLDADELTTNHQSTVVLRLIVWGNGKDENFDKCVL